jgi:hypothetical protein
MAFFRLFKHRVLLVSQENRKLEQSNRDIRKAMTDLIAAGKKE